MRGPYLLPPGRLRADGDAASATLRYSSPLLPLKVTDPAARAMTDFQRDPAPQIGEDLELRQALDMMFRQGVRALLVVRDGRVTGLLAAEQSQPGPLRVVEAMTPASDLPAIDWQVIEDSQVRDLVEIFEGSGARHLVVLENDGANCTSIRGLVHRDRLERALGPRWAASTATRRGVARPVS